MDQWEPNSELVHPGEFRMLDLSAAYAGYTADVASSYPENGQFSKQQKLLYDAILDAQEQAEEILAPGITWAQLYSVAEKALLTHMKAAGILKGDIEKMVEARLLGSVFMPHLLGHQLGMDPHDPDTGDGGYEPLEAGNVVTIEPSLYFQPSLLADLESNSLLKAFVDMEKLEEFRPVGGMRSEDNLVVTDTGCRKLTRVPRRTEDIEAIMSEEMVWKPWEKTIQVYPTKGLKSCTCQRNLFSTTVLLLASIFFYYSH
jgi:Xaa-Pro dipeptidase